MAARRAASAVLLAITIALVCADARADLPGWAIDPVVPGVDHLRHERPGTLSVHAARVAPNAAFALQAVVAGSAVGGLPGNPHGGREYTSDLCGRAGGLICVNGDFFLCPTCGEAAGGLVIDGRPLRSFRPDLAQLSIIDGKVTTQPLGWAGRAKGTVAGERFEFELASLNRDPIPDGISLYTADWGPQSPPNVPRVELVLAAGGALGPGVTGVVPVARRDVAGPIPADAVVLLGTGASAGVLDRLWHLWQTAPSGGHGQIALHTALSAPASLSIGGHPVLLRDGERVPLNRSDPFVLNRHPRTIAGATRDGELLLVTIDGRQPGHSDGLTLFEATDLLVELGAVEAVNLDGGGSTTFIGRCGADRCVRNRPSSGGERPVVSALALVPTRPARPHPVDEVRAASIDADGDVEDVPPSAATPEAPPPIEAPSAERAPIPAPAASQPEPGGTVALHAVADVIASDRTRGAGATPSSDHTALSALATLAALVVAIAHARRGRRSLRRR